MLGVAFRLAFRELRRNLLMVSVGKRMGPGQSSSAPAFKLANADAIAREVPDLVAVAPQASSSSTAIYANQNWGTTFTGSNEQYFVVNNCQIADGRIFTVSEARSGAAVCIISATVRDKLFGAQNPLGTRMRLQKLSCEIIGLLPAKGQSSMGSDQDDIVIVPLRTFQRRIAGNNDVRLIQVSARDGVSTDQVKLDMQRVLRVRRHLSAHEDDNFNVMDMKDISTMPSGTTQMLTSLLATVLQVPWVLNLPVHSRGFCLFGLGRRYLWLRAGPQGGAHGSD